MKKLNQILFLVVFFIFGFVAREVYTTSNDPGVNIWENYKKCVGKIVSIPIIKLSGGDIVERKDKGGVGTGFIISKKSKKILTTDHIVWQIGSTVTIEKSQGYFSDYEAEVVKMKYVFIDFRGIEHNLKPIWIDKKHYLSEMVIDISDKDMEEMMEAPFDDTESIKVTESVLVMGYAGGHNLNIVNGIVSSLEPTINNPFGQIKKLDLFQMSAPINPGQSGGPVIRVKNGKVIGVVYCILHEKLGVSYAAHIHYRPKDD